MKLDSVQRFTWSFLFFISSSLMTASTQQWVCDHYVTPEIPFCSVTLTLLENGKLSSRATIEHQGQTHPSVIQELDVLPGQLFHLNLDADLPGQEIEMIVEEQSNETGKFPAVLINHQAPFAKEMHGVCLRK